MHNDSLISAREIQIQVLPGRFLFQDLRHCPDSDRTARSLRLPPRLLFSQLRMWGLDAENVQRCVLPHALRTVPRLVRIGEGIVRLCASVR